VRYIYNALNTTASKPLNRRQYTEPVRRPVTRIDDAIRDLVGG